MLFKTIHGVHARSSSYSLVFSNLKCQPNSLYEKPFSIPQNKRNMCIVCKKNKVSLTHSHGKTSKKLKYFWTQPFNLKTRLPTSGQNRLNLQLLVKRPNVQSQNKKRMQLLFAFAKKFCSYKAYVN